MKSTRPKGNVRHTSIYCASDTKAAAMRKLSSDVDQKKIDLVDGIRINEGNAWVLVLPGASHPLLHLYGEGETAELRDAIMEEYSAKIREHLAVI